MIPSKNLTSWVKYEAAAAAKRVGFGMRPCVDAPNTYKKLLAAHLISAKTGQLLPVFSSASENTIYTDKLGNWSFRFWHDLCHVEEGGDFTPSGEFAALVPQLSSCALTFGAQSDEYRAFYADTIGQVVAYRMCRFLTDQREFVRFLMEHSDPNVQSTSRACRQWADSLAVA
jgi:hypothetical protein